MLAQRNLQFQNTMVHQKMQKKKARERPRSPSQHREPSPAKRHLRTEIVQDRQIRHPVSKFQKSKCEQRTEFVMIGILRFASPTTGDIARPTNHKRKEEIIQFYFCESALSLKARSNSQRQLHSGLISSALLGIRYSLFWGSRELPYSALNVKCTGPKHERNTKSPDFEDVSGRLGRGPRGRCSQSRKNLGERGPQNHKERIRMRMIQISSGQDSRRIRHIHVLPPPSGTRNIRVFCQLEPTSQLLLCRRGAQGWSGEKPSQCWCPAVVPLHAHTL